MKKIFYIILFLTFLISGCTNDDNTAQQLSIEESSSISAVEIELNTTSEENGETISSSTSEEDKEYTASFKPIN